MDSVAGEQPKAETIIRDIEAKVDADNMRVLNLAIDFFEAGKCEIMPMSDLKILRSLVEKGLHASDEIGRLVLGLHVA